MVYDYLIKIYGRDNVFITTSNKVDPPRSPFTFSEKQQFMHLTGVSADRIVETRDPYRALEVVQKYNPKTARLVFAVSEKDMAEDPRFKFGYKKDGSPTYFQPMPKNVNDMQPFETHGYIMTVPTFNFTVLGEPMKSATEVRAQFAQADEATQHAIVKDLFGAYDRHVHDIMKQKLSQTITESIAVGTKLDLTKNYGNFETLIGVVKDITPSGKLKIQIAQAQLVPGKKGAVRVGDVVTIAANYVKKTVAENFADGRNPQDKGDARRHGVPTKASVSTLRKVAKQGGRKGQLAHWMANMKAGKAKAKKGMAENNLNELAPGNSQGGNGPFDYGSAIVQIGEEFVNYYNDQGAGTDAAAIIKVGKTFMSAGMAAGINAFYAMDTQVRDHVAEQLMVQGFNVKQDIYQAYKSVPTPAGNETQTILSLLKEFVKTVQEPEDRETVANIYKAFQQSLANGFEALYNAYEFDIDADFTKFARTRGVDLNDIAEKQGLAEGIEEDPLDLSSDYALYIANAGRTMMTQLTNLSKKIQTDSTAAQNAKRWNLGDYMHQHYETDDMNAINQVFEEYGVGGLFDQNLYELLANWSSQGSEYVATWKQYSGDVIKNSTRKPGAQSVHEQGVAEGDKTKKLSGATPAPAPNPYLKDILMRHLDEVRHFVQTGYFDPTKPLFQELYEYFANEIPESVRRNPERLERRIGDMVAPYAKFYAGTQNMNEQGMAEGSLNEFAITPDDGKQAGRWLVTYMVKNGITKEKIMVGKNANAIAKYFEFRYRRKPLSVVPYFDDMDLRGQLGLDEQGVAEGSTDDPQFQRMLTNIQQSTPLVDKPSKILRLIKRHKPQWFDEYGMGEVEDTVVDLFDMGRFQGLSAADVLTLVGQELESMYGQPDISESNENQYRRPSSIEAAKISQQTNAKLNPTASKFVWKRPNQIGGSFSEQDLVSKGFKKSQYNSWGGTQAMWNRLTTVGEQLDRPTPTAQQILDKHNLSVEDFIAQLRLGVKVEFEHTKDAKTAYEIALDHLNERPDYYTALTRAGLEEAASGYIPTEAEKDDPRFKTALTVDVRPGTDKKNMRALRLIK
jgi:hypothetical protein